MYSQLDGLEKAEAENIPLRAAVNSVKTCPLGRGKYRIVLKGFLGPREANL
jgi:hypothetical protein